MPEIDPKACAVLALSMTNESMGGYSNGAEMISKASQIMAAARKAGKGRNRAAPRSRSSKVEAIRTS